MHKIFPLIIITIFFSFTTTLGQKLNSKGKPLTNQKVVPQYYPNSKEPYPNKKLTKRKKKINYQDAQKIPKYDEINYVKTYQTDPVGITIPKILFFKNDSAFIYEKMNKSGIQNAIETNEHFFLDSLLPYLENLPRVFKGKKYTPTDISDYSNLLIEFWLKIPLPEPKSSKWLNSLTLLGIKKSVDELPDTDSIYYSIESSIIKEKIAGIKNPAEKIYALFYFSMHIFRQRKIPDLEKEQILKYLLTFAFNDTDFINTNEELDCYEALDFVADYFGLKNNIIAAYLNGVYNADSLNNYKKIAKYCAKIGETYLTGNPSDQYDQKGYNHFMKSSNYYYQTKDTSNGLIQVVNAYIATINKLYDNNIELRRKAQLEYLNFFFYGYKFLSRSDIAYGFKSKYYYLLASYFHMKHYYTHEDTKSQRLSLYSYHKAIDYLTKIRTDDESIINLLPDLIDLSRLYTISKDSLNAVRFINTAIKIAEYYNDTLKTHKCIVEKGNIYSMLGYKKEAKKFIQEGLDLTVLEHRFTNSKLYPLLNRGYELALYVTGTDGFANEELDSLYIKMRSKMLDDFQNMNEILSVESEYNTLIAKRHLNKLLKQKEYLIAEKEQLLSQRNLELKLKELEILRINGKISIIETELKKEQARYNLLTEKNADLGKDNEELKTESVVFLNNIENQKKIIEWQNSILQEQKKDLQNKQDKLNYSSAAIAALALLCAIVFIRFNRNQKKNLALENKLIKEKAEKLNLENESIKAQLNPHFLKNIVGAINQKVKEGQSEIASSALNNLVEFMTIMNKWGEKKMISLNEERWIMNKFIDMARPLVKNLKKINFDFGDYDLDEIQLPPLISISLLENCLKKGVMPFSNKSGIITIILASHSNQLELSFIDNGSGFSNTNINELIKNKDRPGGFSITMQKINAFNKANNSNLELKLENVIDGEKNIVGAKTILVIA